MRKILFRGKRNDNGEWVYGDLLQYQNYDVIHQYKNGCRAAFDVDTSTVGQYTGLSDMEGGRIFEGDIVIAAKWTGDRYIVGMDDERRGWWPFACGDGCGCCEEDTIPPEYCKIIGNIHDNSEIAEGTR